MKFGRFYTLFVVLLFAAFAVVFNTFPRSVYSPLEKRELAQFPAFSWIVFNPAPSRATFRPGLATANPSAIIS